MVSTVLVPTAKAYGIRIARGLPSHHTLEALLLASRGIVPPSLSFRTVLACTILYGAKLHKRMTQEVQRLLESRFVQLLRRGSRT